MHNRLSVLRANRGVENPVRWANRAPVACGSRDPRCLVVLVDVENVSPTLAPRILTAAPRHGKVELRRTFGVTATSEWGMVLIRHSFHQVSRAPSADERNTADIKLTVTSMDMLHDTTTDGF